MIDAEKVLATEDQAATLWCPFARVLLPVNQSGNRISTFHLTLSDPRDREHYAKQQRDCNCIGSRCMAWRWAGYRPVRNSVVEGQDEAHGYCGLVGNSRPT